MPAYKYLGFKVSTNLLLRYLEDAEGAYDLEEVTLSASEGPITGFGGMDRGAAAAPSRTNVYFRAPMSSEADFYFRPAGDTVLLAEKNAFRATFRADNSIAIDLNDRSSAVDPQSTIVNLLLPLYSAWRQFVPIHVGALVHPRGGCVVFSGEGGAGKSTIVAEMALRLGWDILVEDNTAVFSKGGSVQVYPGARNLRLWPDSVSRLRLPSSRDESEVTGKGKTIIRMAEKYAREPVTPVLWVDLAWGERNELRPLGGLETLTAIKSSFYLAPMALQLVEIGTLNNTVSDLLRHTRFYKLERRREAPVAVEELASWIDSVR